MFAKGYDFGWADSPYNDHGNQLIRPGWVSKLKLSVRTVFHDFRDTAATHLLSGTWGEPWKIEMVSEWLGHSDIKVTQERYAHLTDDVKLAAAAKVDPSRGKSVQKVSNGFSKGTELSSGNHAAPEPGLEPGTTRLTAVTTSQDFKHLDTNLDSAWTVQKQGMQELAKSLLEAAMGGKSMKSAALALAGAVLDVTDEPEVSEPVAVPLRLVR
jgi:hypothetical protein